MHNNIEFIQSKKGWWIKKDLNWILDNASFVFTSTNSRKPHIVTKEKVDGMNCFQIDNNNDGITISGTSEFNLEFYGDLIKKREEEDIREFVAIFLIKWGAGEFIVTHYKSPFKKFMQRWFGETYFGLVLYIFGIYWSYQFIKSLF